MDRQMKYNAVVRGNEAELFMDCEHYESECNSAGSSLCEFLLEIGLNDDDIDNDAVSTLRNSSVARPKTLIPVKSADRLHSATAPKNATKFQQMCESIESTGLYLYDSSSTTNIECRQFPKSSGYAEDPATGIAAGALAASLHRHQILKSSDAASNGESGDSVSTTVLQGTAMGRPSQIKVKIDNYTTSCTNNNNPSHCGNVKISYTGLVAFDTVSYLDEAESP
jgi:PhzF family phenazine biosynthesis protein